MKRVLYLVTRAEPGGVQVHICNLLRGFKDRFDLHLAVGEEGFLTDKARLLGTTVHLLPNFFQPIHPLKDVLALREMLILIKQLQPLLVHTHSSKAGILGRVAAHMAGVPTVFTTHGWAFADGVSLKRRLLGIFSERLVGRWTSWIINVSEQDRALAVRYRVAPPDRLVVVHNGVPDVPQLARPGEANGMTIVMVGRFVAQKNQALLLRALAGLRLNFQLCLVGDGPTRTSVEHLASELNIKGRVEFVSWRQDVPQILASAHIFVLTSNWEGFPISVLEAMRAGLPVVASDVGGVREGVLDAKTGFLVPRGDVVTLRERLRQLLTDRVLREQMGTAGRERYLAQFTADQMVEQTLRVYETALAERGSRGAQGGRYTR